MSLFEHPKYPELVETFRHPDGYKTYRLAYRRLVNMHNGSMTEKETHQALGRIQLFEGRWSDLKDFIYGRASNIWQQVIDAFRRLGPKAQLQKIKNEMPMWRQRAREIETKHGKSITDMSTAEKEELYRRVVSEFQYQIPDDIDKKIRQDFGLTSADEAFLGLDAGVPKEAFRVSWFIQKSLWAGLLYSLALVIWQMATPAVVFIPWLIATLDDLLYQLSQSKYMTV